MKINRLMLEGFGPFHARQEIDFSDYHGELFLISGRTGHGKSSILDGIAYGLYGTVPRFGGESKPSIRSTFSQPGEKTEVVLEFSLGDSTFRVTRSPSYPRPKARGEGQTETKEEALLEELLPSGWKVVAQGKQNVGSEVNSLIRLTNDQFLQVIMLAQNRFRDFLHAPSDDRREILRAIFGTKSYSDFVDIVGEKEKQERIKSEAIRERIDRLREEAETVDDSVQDAPDADDWWSWATSAIATRERLLEEESARTKRERTHAAKQLAEAIELAQAQDQRAQLNTRHDALLAEKEAIGKLEIDIEAAKRAESLRPVLENRDETRIAHREAIEALQHLAEELGRKTDNDTTQEVAKQVSDLQELIARLEPLTSVERELPEKTLKAERLRNSRNELIEKVENNTKTRNQKKKESEQATKELRGLRKTLESYSATQQSLDQAKKALESSRQLIVLENRVEALEEAVEKEESLLAQVTKDLEELTKKRIEGIAGELATGLSAGEPCSVCGSTEHPKPARLPKNAISEEDVNAVEIKRKASEVAVREARSQLAKVKEESAHHRALAEEKTSKEWERAVEGIESELASRESTTERIAQLDALLATNESEIERLEQLGNEKQSEKALVEGELSALEKELAKDEQSLSANREDFTTVTDRRNHLAISLDQLKQYLKALEEKVSSETRLEKEVAKLEAKIKQSAFDSEADLVAALKDEQWQTDAQKRVSDHSKQLNEVLTLLGQLKTIPTGAVDVESIRQESAEKDKADDEATSRLTLVRDRKKRLADLRTRHDEAVREASDLSDRYNQLQSFSGTLKGQSPNEKRMNLETFVLASQLEDIVDAANRRFASMSDSRYLLEHDDERGKGQGQFGLGIKVFDNFTGVSRLPTSLSGGETFLASLALALGLADVVTETNGAIELDTLFIDEGFGSLDQETLETTMETLDSLRAGGRTVGAISHVDSMKEQIPLQIRVAQGADHASTISLVT